MATLQDITGKSNTIYTGMDQAVKTAIDDRIDQASTKERAKLEKVLHFSWAGNVGTTEASRLDTRRALVGYLAEGGSVEGAEQLRKMLKDLSADKIKDLADKLTQQPTEFDKSLPRPFLTSNNPDAANNIKGMAVVLSGLPAKLGKVGQMPWCNDNIAVLRDSQGMLRVGSTQQWIDRIKKTCTDLGVKSKTVDKLNGVFGNLNADKAAQAFSMMAGPDGNVAKGLSSALKVSTLTPKQDLQHMTAVFDELPKDLSKAGQIVSGDDCLTLKRDDQGAIKLVNAHVTFTGVDLPDSNLKLKAQNVQDIKSTFKQLATANYSRAGGPLDFIRHAREESLKDSKVTMGDAFKSYTPECGKLAEQTKSSDCIGLTDQLIGELKKQGITAYAAGSYNEGLAQQRVGSEKHTLPGVEEDSGMVTHLDVIVPYTDENDEERVLVLISGMGSQDEMIKDVTKAKFLQIFSNRLSSEGKSVDIVSAQKSAMGYLTNIMIANGEPKTPGVNEVAGIDLVKGTLYLNTAASKAYQGAKIPSDTTLAFNYRDAMLNPDDKVKMTNAKGKEVEVTKLEALAVFAEGVKDHFGLPDDFVDNVMHLAANEQQYHQGVLWSSAQSMHKLDQGVQITQKQKVVVNPLDKVNLELKGQDLKDVDEKKDIKVPDTKLDDLSSEGVSVKDNKLDVIESTDSDITLDEKQPIDQKATVKRKPSIGDLTHLQKVETGIEKKQGKNISSSIREKMQIFEQGDEKKPEVKATKRNSVNKTF